MAPDGTTGTPGSHSGRPTVLVAGGTGGLGPAVVHALLEGGWPVVTVSRNEVESKGLAGAHHRNARLRHLRADLLDPGETQTSVDGIDDLGAVVNLVGGYSGGADVAETDPASFERMLALNVRPSFLLARAALPKIAARGGGAFVAVSARAALHPFAGAAGYVTAKAALLAFVRALDVEYRHRGVRANAVIPGVIDTPANREAQPHADHSGWVAPAGIARVIAFLVSDASRATSGAAIPVYGAA
jgi:NAD(P)-dependent dehydrogenase (short-subunit alcohol dehydrogenase family)